MLSVFEEEDNSKKTAYVSRIHRKTRNPEKRSLITHTQELKLKSGAAAAQASRVSAAAVEQGSKCAFRYLLSCYRMTDRRL